jgi:hypothetical protein
MKEFKEILKSNLSKPSTVSIEYQKMTKEQKLALLEATFKQPETIRVSQKLAYFELTQSKQKDLSESVVDLIANGRVEDGTTLSKQIKDSIKYGKELKELQEQLKATSEDFLKEQLNDKIKETAKKCRFFDSTAVYQYDSDSTPMNKKIDYFESKYMDKIPATGEIEIFGGEMYRDYCNYIRALSETDFDNLVKECIK